MTKVTKGFIRRGSIASGVATALGFIAILGGVGIWVNYKMKSSPGKVNGGDGTDQADRTTFDPNEGAMSFGSLVELYNPNLEGAPEDWSLVETLNSEEVQSLAIKVDSLSKNYVKLETKLIPAAQEIYPRIAQMKPILWEKLLKKSWKDPKIPGLYHELAKDKPDAFDFLISLPNLMYDAIKKKMMADRIEHVKDFLLGGKVRAGDRKFVNKSTPYVEAQVADLEHRLAIVEELARRFEAEMKLDAAEQR